MNARQVTSLLLIALLESCGGGGGNGVLPGSPGKTATSTKPVKIALVIPNTSSSSARRPHFVSPSALGASIAVTGSLGGSASAVADLSSGSAACTTSGSQRTCSASVTVPIDTDTFVVTLYDAAPVSGAIPASAHVLGVGTVTQAVSITFAGPLAILVGGSISTIGLASTFASVPADGATHNVGVTIAPADFGNNPLGGSNAPYANPITATLTETSGSTMTLLLDNASSGTTATLKNPTDSIAVRYNGTISPGDSATLTLSATGAPTQTMTISPMIVTSPSTFYGNYTLSLNGNATDISMNVSETNAPSAPAFAATATGCASVAALTPVTVTATNGSFNVAGGSAASGSGCSVAVTDGTSTVTFDVVNTPIGGTIPLPGESIQEYTFNTSPPSPPVSPGAAVRGPDGRVWFADRLSGGLAAVTTSGVVTQYTAPPLYTALTVGSDGDIYAGDPFVGGTIYKISPSTGASLSSTVTTFPIVGEATGPDGNVWATESGGSSGDVGVLSPSGAFIQYAVTIYPSPNPAGISAAPDGTMWFCDNHYGSSGSEIDSVSMTGTFTLIAPIATDTCGAIAFQSDGKAAWVTSGATTNVYRIDATTHAVATVALSGTPYAVAAGADNAIYVTETGGATGWVARISNGAPTPYTPNEIVAPHGFPTGIALGADGRMWYGENSVNTIGALSP